MEYYIGIYMPTILLGAGSVYVRHSNTLQKGKGNVIAYELFIGYVVDSIVQIMRTVEQSIVSM